MKPRTRPFERRYAQARQAPKETTETTFERTRTSAYNTQVITLPGRHAKLDSATEPAVDEPSRGDAGVNHQG